MIGDMVGELTGKVIGQRIVRHHHGGGGLKIERTIEMKGKVLGEDVTVQRYVLVEGAAARGYGGERKWYPDDCEG